MSTEPLVTISNARIDRRSGDSCFQLRIDHLVIGSRKRFALVGPSGCGKSTLLDFLALIAPPSTLDGFRFSRSSADVVDLAPVFLRGDLDALAEIRRAYIGYVLQTGGLLSSIDVRRNIAFPLELIGSGDTGQVDRVGSRLGIGSHMQKMPAALSSGERQRVAIARAIVHGPRLLLADEPTASLDPARADDVMQLLVELAEEGDRTLVVASHDIERMHRFGFTSLQHEFLPSDAPRTTIARFGNPETRP